MSSIQLEKEFINLCKSGNIEQVCKFYTDNPKVDIHTKNYLCDYAFHISCANGHFSIAEWLYLIGDGNWTINDCLFKTVCMRGHIDCSQWIFQIYKSLDIKLYIELLIIHCLKTSHLNILEWLIKINPNINNHYLNQAFELVKNNHNICSEYFIDRYKSKLNLLSKDNLIILFNFINQPIITKYVQYCFVCGYEREIYIKLLCDHLICINCYYNFETCCHCERVQIEPKSFNKKALIINECIFDHKNPIKYEFMYDSHLHKLLKIPK